MIVAYTLEARDHRWIAVFAADCASTAFYGVQARSWIFATLEVVGQKSRSAASPNATVTRDDFDFGFGDGTGCRDCAL